MSAATAENIPVITEEELLAMSEDEYMNDVQQTYFRTLLTGMREEMTSREREVKDRLHTNEIIADPADRATAEEEHWLDLRLREREAILVRKIDKALRLLDEGEYGFCEETGEPIGIPRLLARPTATVGIDAKAVSEHTERSYRDPRDN